MAGAADFGGMKGVLVVLAALLLARYALLLLMPIFRRYALARPNARSTHRAPVPQSGGIGILIGGLGIGVPTCLSFGWPGHTLLLLTGLTIAMAVLGAIDDLKALGWRIRILAQTLMVVALLVALPAEWRLIDTLPLLVERGVAAFLGVWFINLTNFMDGIDGMLAVGTAPLFLTIGSGFFGLTSPDPLALAFGGALLGFLMLNRPPATVFAGDVGSLAIGFMGAALLFFVATRYSLAAAIILPMYFVADATSTLFIRTHRRSNLTLAHREHAYQQAIDRGLPCRRIILEVALLNLSLSILAVLAIRFPPLAIVLLVTALVITAGLIWRLRRVGR